MGLLEALSLTTLLFFAADAAESSGFGTILSHQERLEIASASRISTTRSLAEDETKGGSINEVVKALRAK